MFWTFASIKQIQKQNSADPVSHFHWKCLASFSKLNVHFLMVANMSISFSNFCSVMGGREEILDCSNLSWTFLCCWFGCCHWLIALGMTWLTNDSLYDVRKVFFASPRVTIVVVRILLQLSHLSSIRKRSLQDSVERQKDLVIDKVFEIWLGVEAVIHSIHSQPYHFFPEGTMYSSS